MSERPVLARRTFIVHRAFQYRFMLRFIGTAAVGIILSCLIMTGWYWLEYSSADSPLRFYYLDSTHGGNLQEVMLIEFIWPALLVSAGLSLVFTWLFALIYSHRIAGPLFNLRRVIREIRQGRLPDQVRFRQADEFHELSKEMTLTLAWLRTRIGRPAAGRRPGRRGRAHARVALFIAGALAASRSRATFEKGGVLDGSPRSAALAGATVALPGDLVDARGVPASLARLDGPQAGGAFGVAPQPDLKAFSLGAAGVAQGLGFSALLTQLGSGTSTQRIWSGNLGLPVEEVAGLSVGAGVKVLDATFPGDHGTGFGFDVGVLGDVPVPWPQASLSVAATVEDALGSLEWESGLREDVPSQVRLGFAGRWGPGFRVVGEWRVIRSALRAEPIGALGVENEVPVQGWPVILRVGYRDGRFRTGSFAGGLGTRYGPATLDYAAVGGAGLGVQHLVAVGWRFGPVAEQAGGPAETVSAPAANADIVPEASVFHADDPWRPMHFTLNPPRVDLITGWGMIIRDAAGTVIWSAEADGEPPREVTWTGDTLAGDPAPAGTYTCHLVLRGSNAYQHLSRGVTFRLERTPKAPADPDAQGPGGF